MPPARWRRSSPRLQSKIQNPRSKIALIEQHLEIPAGRYGRIDQAVRDLTGRSRADIRGLFHHRCVQLNAEVCAEPGKLTQPGDVVTVRHDPRQRYHAPPPARTSKAFRLVYEDDDLLVVDKAAAVLTVPTERGESNTLLDAVTAHLKRRNPRARAGVVQRLDRGTSGLLVFAKSPRITSELEAQFRARKAEREYVAIVAGTLEQPAGTFRTRLATTKSLQRYSLRDAPDDKRNSPARSRGERDEGELAITHYQVERPLRGATLVRVRLETGRRNQIRVHFSEAEHPVLGDERYRPDLAQHPAWKAKRLALHAAVLGFDHPRTGKRLRFESPLPVEFERFLAGASR